MTKNVSIKLISLFIIFLYFCEGALGQQKNMEVLQLTLEKKQLGLGDWIVEILALLILVGGVIAFHFFRLKTIREQKERLESLVNKHSSELLKTNQELEQKKILINQKEEALAAQRDTLAEKELMIVQQNQELVKHRFELDTMVKERTIDLEEQKIKAEESERLKSAFLANMSHEIRTPMNAVIGFSSMLKDPEFSTEEKDIFIDIITNNSNSLLDLLNDIIDLSKIQTTKTNLFYSYIDVYTLMKETFDINTINLKDKPIDYVLNTDHLPLNTTIQADQIRLRQVFNNLINNAFKFTKSGKIEFGVKEVNSQNLIFYIADTGIGISEGVGNRVFDKFLKIEHLNESELFPGTGIGLAICKQLVELWGGQIWYESQRNIGTTFYVSHPITPFL